MKSPFLKKDKKSSTLPKTSPSLYIQELLERSDKAIKKLKKLLSRLD